MLDNFIRGVPAWLTALERRTRTSGCFKHDITHPLPADLGDMEYLIHAASIASPMYYRKYPIETMDANVNGLRFCSSTAWLRSGSRRPVEGILFYSSSEIYGDPTPENIPTPETYRGNVSCTGPRACYDESKRYGETLCVNFARQHELPDQGGAAVQQLRPGPEDHRPPRHSRFCARHSRRPGHRDAVGRLGDSGRSVTSADAVVGYYKVLVKGRPGEAYNIGVETPEISMTELADRLVDLGRELFGYTGQVVRQGERGQGLPRRQSEPPLPHHHQGPDRARLRPAGDDRRRPAAFADLVLGQPRGIGRVMKISIIGTGYVGLVTGACLAEEGPST